MCRKILPETAAAVCRDLSALQSLPQKMYPTHCEHEHGIRKNQVKYSICHVLNKGVIDILLYHYIQITI